MFLVSTVKKATERHQGSGDADEGAGGLLKEMALESWGQGTPDQKEEREGETWRMGCKERSRPCSGPLSGQPAGAGANSPIRK